MANIDINEIEKEIAKLAASLFKDLTNQAISDGKAYLAKTKQQLIDLAKDKATKAITQAEYDNALSNIKALAKMEKLKREALAQETIDKFTDGVTDIVLKAAFAAIKI